MNEMSQADRLIAFIVDDENIVASTLELILISKGFDARSFVNPVDALMAAQSVAPHLLLTDVVMPNMNGIELAIQIKQLWPDCKVLLCSGQAETVDLIAAAREQGNHFEVVAKPIHPDDLFKTIERLFNPSETTNAVIM